MSSHTTTPDGRHDASHSLQQALDRRGETNIPWQQDWDAALGLWSKPDGHTRPVAHLSRVHAAPEEAADLSAVMQEAAAYWRDHEWGWGEHLSDCYANVCLVVLSALAVFICGMATGCGYLSRTVVLVDARTEASRKRKGNPSLKGQSGTRRSREERHTRCLACESLTAQFAGSGSTEAV
jgi:hypothetical protein